jgi:hypothetical protein
MSNAETFLTIFVGTDFAALLGLVAYATTEFWGTFPEMVKSMMTMFYKD